MGDGDVSSLWFWRRSSLVSSPSDVSLPPMEGLDIRAPPRAV